MESIDDQDGVALGATDAAALFAALGAEPRLAILRLLVRAGPDGLSVGLLQARLGIAASTLSHHLKALIAAGAVTQERQGRRLCCRADFDRVSALARFLVSECCADMGALEDVG